MLNMSGCRTGFHKPLYKLQLSTPFQSWDRDDQESPNPCSPLFLARTEQTPGHSKCQTTPWATQATITSPTLTEGITAEGMINGSETWMPLTYWKTEMSWQRYILLDRICSKFSFLSAKSHHLHPRKAPSELLKEELYEKLVKDCTISPWIMLLCTKRKWRWLFPWWRKEKDD